MNNEEIPKMVDISSQVGAQANIANIEQGKTLDQKKEAEKIEKDSDSSQIRERAHSSDELKEVIEATRERFLNIFKGQPNIKSVVVMPKKPIKRENNYTVKVTRKMVTHVSGSKSSPRIIEYMLDDGSISLNKQSKGDEFREEFYDTLNDIGQAIDADKAEVFEERGQN